MVTLTSHQPEQTYETTIVVGRKLGQFSPTIITVRPVDGKQAVFIDDRQLEEYKYVFYELGHVFDAITSLYIKADVENWRELNIPTSQIEDLLDAATAAGRTLKITIQP